MRRIVEYGLIFTVAVLLQVLLFNNLHISPYFYPLVYVSFIVLLPLNTKPVLSLVLGFILGVSVDLLSGMAGLNTIASTATGFVRPAIAGALLGKDALREAHMPLPLNVGNTKWLRYAAATVTVNCTVFFFSEVLSFSYIWFTILRTFGSILSTTLLIWFAAYIWPAGREGYK